MSTVHVVLLQMSILKMKYKILVWYSDISFVQQKHSYQNKHWHCFCAQPTISHPWSQKSSLLQLIRTCYYYSLKYQLTFLAKVY